jgi:hypothetical protein
LACSMGTGWLFARYCSFSPTQWITQPHKRRRRQYFDIYLGSSQNWAFFGHVQHTVSWNDITTDTFLMKIDIACNNQEIMQLA